MLLQHQTVSRKTPDDGRLEISAETADRISTPGGALRLATEMAEAEATVETLTCTCGKRGEGTHIHYFLESSVLRGLVPGSEVRVELDQPGIVRVSPISP